MESDKKKSKNKREALFRRKRAKRVVKAQDVLTIPLEETTEPPEDTYPFFIDSDKDYMKHIASIDSGFALYAFDSQVYIQDKGATIASIGVPSFEDFHVGKWAFDALVEHELNKAIIASMKQAGIINNLVGITYGLRDVSTKLKSHMGIVLSVSFGGEVSALSVSGVLDVSLLWEGKEPDFFGKLRSVCATFADEAIAKIISSRLQP